MSSSFVDELDEEGNGSAINQVIEEHLGTFLDVAKANDGRRLTSKSAKSGSQLDLVVSACFCDYTDDAITCDAEFGEERGVASIISNSSPRDIGDYPLTTVDLDLSGLPYLAISVACYDFLGGQGPVSRARRPRIGFECYSNNGFGHIYDGEFTRELFCLKFGCYLTKIHLAPFPVRRPVSRLQRAFQA